MKKLPLSRRRPFFSCIWGADKWVQACHRYGNYLNLNLTQVNHCQEHRPGPNKRLEYFRNIYYLRVLTKSSTAQNHTKLPGSPSQKVPWKMWERYWGDGGGMDPWIILISILVARHASSVLLWKRTIKANTRSLLKDYRTNCELSKILFFLRPRHDGCFCK